jgi:hypothetical protein
MQTRRDFTLGLGASLVSARAAAEPSREFALLVAAPWPGESYLAADISLMQAALQARGITSADTTTGLVPLDRATLMRHLGAVKAKISAWSTGQIFLYYNGHGMYGPPAGGRPEPGLQLGPNRGEHASFVLWRELFDALALPPGVRLLVLPDCCHTNLLVGRVPVGVTAFIMKSDPQDSLNCRTGTALFGAGPGRVRHGVVSYYAASTISSIETAGQWLTGMKTTADNDIAAGALDPRRRVPVMLEGDESLRILGRPRIPRPPRAKPHNVRAQGL